MARFTALITVSLPIGSHRKQRRMSSGARANSRSIRLSTLAEMLPAFVVDGDGGARAEDSAQLHGVAGRQSSSAVAR